MLGSDHADLLCNELYEETNMQLAMHIIVFCLGYHDVCFSVWDDIILRHSHIRGWEE